MRLFPKKGEGSGEKQVRCSFCAKGKDPVDQLVTGPSVYICNECVDLCSKMLAEHTATQS